tara:strand:- start:1461 stop:1919 length:459 start_codon:yes stop_codon:yes gene_type:complete
MKRTTAELVRDMYFEDIGHYDKIIAINRKRCQENHVDINRKKLRKFKDYEVSWIQDQYNLSKKNTLQRIANTFDVSVNVIYKIINNKYNPYHEHEKYTYKAYFNGELLSEHQTLLSMANQYKVAESTMSNYLTELRNPKAGYKFIKIKQIIK